MNRKIASTRQRLTNLLAIVAVGTGITMSFSATADAAPRDRDVRDARKEVKAERKDLKKAKKEVRKADTREERRDAKEDARQQRRDVKEARKDVKEERRENRNDGEWNNGRYNTNNTTTNNNNNNTYNNYRSFTGKVTDVNNNGEFKLRVGGQTLDVYSSRLPRGFDVGDIVRVYGVRSGGDDIRNANVSIINNR